MKRVFFIFIIYILLPVIVSADDLKRVEFINVSDSNTIWIKDDNVTKIIGLYGLSTPDEYSNEAIKYVKSLFKGTSNIEIKYLTEENDKYNRSLALVYLDGVFLNKTLISEGIYELSIKEDSREELNGLCSEEDKAFQNQKGIWSLKSTKGIVCVHKRLTEEDNKKDNQKKDETKNYDMSILYKLIFISSSILLLLVIWRLK